MSQALRTRKTAPSSQINTFKILQKFPPPGSELGAREMVLYTRIIRSRELETWSEADVVLATILAKLVCEQEKLFDVICKKGAIYLNPKTGATGPSGEFRAHNTLVTQIVKIFTGLGLSFVGRHLNVKEMAIRSQSERATREISAKAEGDDLLA